jgi:hypothetical protein
MNLVFGSEVVLLGFWEYMFQILFRVWCGATLQMRARENSIYLVLIYVFPEMKLSSLLISNTEL